MQAASTGKARRNARFDLPGVLQLCLVVAVAACGALTLGGRASNVAALTEEREELVQRVQEDAATMLTRVAYFAATRDDEIRDEIVRAHADLSARLEALGAIWPERGQAIRAIHVAAQATMDTAETVWSAGTPKAKTESLGQFQQASRQLDEQLARLAGDLIESSVAHSREFAALAYAVLAGVVAVHVIVGFAFLWRQRRREQELAEGVDSLEKVLRNAFEPTPPKAARTDDESSVAEAASTPAGLEPTPSVPALFGSRLRDAVEKLRSEHAVLVETERHERQHARFAQELIEALEIDDTPDHVYATVDRAVRTRMDDTDFRLLVSDNSGTSLEDKVSVGQAACEAPLPHRCPAIRKGRLVSFAEDAGLARCPFLKDDSTRALCAPVASAGKAFAVAQMSWDGETPESQRSDFEGDLLTLVGTLGTRLGVLRTLEERELQAATDPLTGLANRRAMNQRLGELQRSGKRFGVIACDLDHFKKLNDVHGHDTGDKCLVTFARVLKEAARANDLACRPGGEEFLLILADVDGPQAATVAARLRDALADAVRRTGGPAFTCSMGIACAPEHGESYDELLAVSDRALYVAKEQGRDRAVVAGAPAPGPPVALERAEVPASLDDEDQKEEV